MPDEDTFIFPAAWRRYVLPRHGDGRPRRALPASLPSLEEMRREADPLLADAVGNPGSDAELARAGRGFLADPEHPEPFAAAVLTACQCVTEPAPAGWIASHGPIFAAQVALELLDLSCGHTTHVQSDRTWATDCELRREPVAGYIDSKYRKRQLDPIRAMLAALPDREYAQARDQLAGYRDRGSRWRSLTSFLLPTETDWVDADCADTGPHSDYLQVSEYPLLWCAVSTAAQRDLLPGTEVSMFRDPVVLYTLIDALGLEALPALARVMHGGLRSGSSYDREVRAPLVPTLLSFPTDEAFELIRKYVPTQLSTAAARYPARAVRLLAEHGADEALSRHVVAYPEAVEEALPALGEAARQRVDALRARQSRPPLAPAEALPAVLAAPPWRSKRAAKPVVLKLTAPTAPVVEDWPDGLRERWLHDAAQYRAYHLHWVPELRARVRATGRLDALDADDQQLFLAYGELADTRPYAEQWRRASDRSRTEMVALIVARHGALVYPGVLATVTSNPNLLELVTPFVADEVPALMADRLGREKSRRLATDWLTEHPEFAAGRLIPPALGPVGRRRRAAADALVLLDRHGHRDVVRSQAEQYGPAVVRAIAELLDDPAAGLPATIPALPDWLVPATLPPVLLTDGRALPDDAVRHLCTMLAISAPGERYPGVSIVRDACTGESLSAFGWAVFELWRQMGNPGRHAWALRALGALGDDSTALALAPIIRAWPGESAHHHAVAGLDVLAEIGTDTALGQLYAISQRASFAALKKRAGERVDEVAQHLGLSGEQLGDRLVPDLGLSADGSMVLDYGPRRFVVGFDEQLKPYVTDEAGKPRRALPKPGVRDDAELASQSYQRFSALRKQVRSIAADQVARLERAMVTRRRWHADDFRRYLVDHPLVRHLARRLVWGIWSDGELATSFRVAEDGTLAGPGDDEYTLPDDAVVGLPHPLELAGSLSGWAEVFADYQLAQPFEQLARSVHAVGAADVSGNELTRFAGTTVLTGRLLGMEKRGWRRGDPSDNGVATWLQRELPDGRYVLAPIDPGIVVGDPDALGEEQQLGALYIARSVHDRAHDALPLSTVDNVIVSEVLRDLTAVTAG